MASPKKQELLYLLTLQLFKQECLAIISKYVHEKSEAESIYNMTAAELLQQNAENVRQMEFFVKAAVRNKAKLYFKERLESKETSIHEFKEKPAVNPVFSHIQFDEIRNAVKQHRSELDFIIFELNSQGYSHNEIADLLNKTNITEGAVRKRLHDLRNWIKRFFNEK